MRNQDDKENVQSVFEIREVEEQAQSDVQAMVQPGTNQSTQIGLEWHIGNRCEFVEEQQRRWKSIKREWSGEERRRSGRFVKLKNWI